MRHDQPQVFVMRCAVCDHEIHEMWGPDVHSLARQRLIEHVSQHSDIEIRAWAMPRLVGRELEKEIG